MPAPLQLHSHPLDQYSYEDTLSLADFVTKVISPFLPKESHDSLMQNKLGKIDIFVINLGPERREGRSQRIFKGPYTSLERARLMYSGAIRDDVLAHVKQIVARINFYPIFLEDEIHWAKSLAARYISLSLSHSISYSRPC